MRSCLARPALRPRHQRDYQQPLSSQYYPTGHARDSSATLSTTGHMRVHSLAPAIGVLLGMASWWAFRLTTTLDDTETASHDADLLFVSQEPADSGGTDGRDRWTGPTGGADALFAEEPFRNAFKWQCSDDDDCVLSCLRDIPECCDQLCGCTLAWSRTYATTIHAFRSRVRVWMCVYMRMAE